tara:strand:- start:811 stop:1623 length:813 start_codon:yes stop_codon:yes gene_type:complete
MKLLINGCSFTGGSEVIHDPETNLITNNGQTTWADHFKEDFETNNVAVGGNSNDKIFRRTVEELNKESYDYAIIQWTAIHRKERYSDMRQTWINFCQTESFTTNNQFFETASDSNKRDLYGYHTDNHADMDRGNPKLSSVLKSYDKIRDGLVYDVFYGKTLQDFRVEYFKNVLSLQNILDKKNIKYIFTSMSFENHIPNIKTNWSFDRNIAITEFEQDLLDQMDLSVWTKNPMTHMMNQNKVSQNDGHPNEIGHKLIYNHVQKELNKIYG